MFDNVIVLSDGANKSYDLISRTGMKSLRRELGVASNTASTLAIEHSIDLNNPSTKNRHLTKLSWNEVIDGVVYPASVHVVISRHKMVSDTSIKSKLLQIADLINTEADQDKLLLGGN